MADRTVTEAAFDYAGVVGRARQEVGVVVAYCRGNLPFQAAAISPTLTVGRDSSADLAVDDAGVSRAHVRFENRGSQVHVTDLGSRNGTWVNGDRVGAQGLLAPVGSVVRIGKTLLVVAADVSPYRMRRARSFPDIVGGASLDDARVVIDTIAATKTPVLILGDTGTGKEVVAKALHDASGRAGQFVALNCAAVPHELVDAELFGHTRGAFSGAVGSRAGLFRTADRGTLFLDEIGELPANVQAKLLRVLETGLVRRLGDSVVRQTDVRLVAATNRDLDTEVRENRFRADLLYRLDALRVAMPALEQRLDDIPRLVEHFLRLEGAKNGTKRHMSPEVLAKLCARAWPGNVRELSNEVARLCVLSSGDITDPLLVRVPHETSAPSFLDQGAIPTLAELERLAIQAAIERAGGDKTKAAEMLGISRAKVYQRVKEWRDGEASITSAS